MVDKNTQRDIAEVPDAIFLLTTDSVEFLTHISVKIGLEVVVYPKKIIATGTTLDTARFRVSLGKHVGVDSQHVQAYLIGAHGDFEVLA